MSTNFNPGRLVMVDIPGKTLTPDEAAFLREQGIRAVCLFRRNLGTEAEVRPCFTQLIEVMGPEALIGLDQEGGGGGAPPSCRSPRPQWRWVPAVTRRWPRPPARRWRAGCGLGHQLELLRRCSTSTTTRPTR